MRKFDPWPVFFKREWERCWPFIAGFGVTGSVVTWMTANLTDEEAINSPFVKRHPKAYAAALERVRIKELERLKEMENLKQEA